jgi:hypothetical protein
MKLQRLVEGPSLALPEEKCPKLSKLANVEHRLVLKHIEGILSTFVNYFFGIKLKWHIISF